MQTCGVWLRTTRLPGDCQLGASLGQHGDQRGASGGRHEPVVVRVLPQRVSASANVRILQGGVSDIASASLTCGRLAGKSGACPFP